MKIITELKIRNYISDMQDILGNHRAEAITLVVAGFIVGVILVVI